LWTDHITAVEVGILEDHSGLEEQDDTELWPGGIKGHPAVEAAKRWMSAAAVLKGYHPAETTAPEDP